MTALEVIGRVALGLVLAWSLVLVLLLVLRPRHARTLDVVRLVPDVARLGRSLATDPAVPRRVRVSLLALLAWLVNPIDLIPEFVPVLGPLDDVIVAVLVLRYVRREVGDAVLRARWPGSEDGFRLLLGVLGGR